MVVGTAMDAKKKPLEVGKRTMGSHDKSDKIGVTIWPKDITLMVPELVCSCAIEVADCTVGLPKGSALDGVTALVTEDASKHAGMAPLDPVDRAVDIAERRSKPTVVSKDIGVA